MVLVFVDRLMVEMNSMSGGRMEDFDLYRLVDFDQDLLKEKNLSIFKSQKLNSCRKKNYLLVVEIDFQYSVRDRPNNLLFFSHTSQSRDQKLSLAVMILLHQ